MYRPLFSASYSDKFNSHQYASSQEKPVARWKRGFLEDGVNSSLGYYLEPVPPSLLSATASASSSPASGAEANHGTDLSQVAQSGKIDSHGFHVYIHKLQVVLLGISLFSPAHPRMAVKTHRLVSLWFAVTIPLVFWDSLYLLMRPRSMEGGDLHRFWKPYAFYQTVDLNYGLKAYEEGHGFPSAQALLSIVENFMNIGYLYLAHVKSTPSAPLLGFASAAMTLSKTALYWLQEYYCGGCSIRHNNLDILVFVWAIPMSLWLIGPVYVMSRLGADISAALHISGSAKKEISGKMQ